MTSAPEIRDYLAKLISEGVSLDDFEDWFVPHSWNIHQGGDPEAQALVYSIEHALALYEDNEGGLRDRLGELLLASGKNQSGNPVPLSIAKSNATSDFILVAA